LYIQTAINLWIWKNKLHEHRFVSLANTTRLLLSSTAAGCRRRHTRANAAANRERQVSSHKFEQPIGEETYTVTRDGDSLVVSSTFEFTDRGTKVPLSAELRAAQDLTPENFKNQSSVSRFSTIDSSVEIKGKSATIRENKGHKAADRAGSLLHY